MSADPEEEDVLMSQFDSFLDSPPLRPAIAEMVAMEMEADLAEIQQPIIPTPFTPEIIEQLFTCSAIMQAIGASFIQQTEAANHHLWQLTYKGQNHTVTFYPDVFEEMPSLRLISFGDPLFEKLLAHIEKLPSMV